MAYSKQKAKSLLIKIIRFITNAMRRVGIQLIQKMHRAGQRYFELLALIGSPQLL